MLGKIGALTTKNIYWLRKRERVLLAPECLALHGINVQSYDKIKDTLTQHEILMMAGDMISAYSLIPQLLAQMLCFGKMPTSKV